MRDKYPYGQRVWVGAPYSCTGYVFWSGFRAPFVRVYVDKLGYNVTFRGERIDLLTPIGVGNVYQ